MIWLISFYGNPDAQPNIFLFAVREVTEDVQLGEYVIGKGTAIMVPIHLLNMDKKFWKNVSSTTSRAAYTFIY